MIPTSETGAASPLIITRGLTKTYGYLPALRKLDLEIARGELVALLGPNGSGKSTLLRLIAGLSAPSTGMLTVGGWTMPREAAAVRAQIGMVGHKPLLYENLTAWENLEFFAAMYGLPPAERAGRMDMLLSRVGLSKRAHTLVREYSRGMLQRLSIARALLHDPDVLLLDEPHTGLDPVASVLLDDLAREHRAAGKTILLTTHDLDRAAALATRVIILARGALVHDAPNNAISASALIDLYTNVTGSAPLPVSNGMNPRSL